MAARTLHLLEDLSRELIAQRVDRAKGIIYGVRVLGWKSENNRDYLPEAGKAALKLYESRKVNVDHPARPGEPRKARDRFGKLMNARVEADGVRADLKYLKSHPLAESVCEAAESMPDAFGLSHNATGDGEWKAGRFVVSEITEVRSVDLVADPATTGGLFESRGQPMRITFRAFLEQLASRSAEPRQRALRALLEQDPAVPMADAEMEMPASPPDAGGASDPDEALKGGFQAAMGAAQEAFFSGGMSLQEFIAKVKELGSAFEKLTGKGSGGSKPPSEGDSEEKKAMEQREREEYQALKREKRGRDLCEQHRLPADRVDAVLLESLGRCPDDASMVRLIEREKARGGATAGQKPRSGSQPPAGGSHNGEIPTEKAALGKWLLG